MCAPGVAPWSGDRSGRRAGRGGPAPPRGRSLAPLAALVLVLGAACGATTEPGGKGFGEECRFVSGQQPSGLGGVEYSNVSECASGYCLALLSQRYCTQKCSAPSDCPEGALCAPVTGAGSFCLAVGGPDSGPDTAGGGDGGGGGPDVGLPGEDAGGGGGPDVPPGPDVPVGPPCTPEADAACGVCAVCDGQGGCRPAAAGEDPKDDCATERPDTCGSSGACDGAGACALYGAEMACDDGAACTFSDRCDGAGGCAGTPIECADDPGACGVRRACDGTAACAETLPGPETACDDDDPCTYDDRCDGAGGCAGTALTCTDDPAPCGAQRACDGTAACAVTWPGAEAACDDGDLCTYDDRCDGSGGCGGTAIVCADEPTTCGARRTCDGTAACSETLPGAETGCDDGALCTYDDRCDGAGGCAGTTLVCTDEPLPCGLRRTCDGTAACRSRLPGAEAICDDGALCTYDDRCDGAGGCAGTPLECLDDAGPCGARRTCDGTAACAESFPGAETTCDDAEPCTYDDRCDEAGGCAGAPVVCEDDSAPCGLRRTCNGTATCSEAWADGAEPCDDGDLCTYADHCDGEGSCAVGLPILCVPDPGPCGVVRECDGTDACVETFPGAETPCPADGDPCTFSTCDGAGACGAPWCWYDPSTDLTWQQPPSPSEWRWLEAFDYCEALDLSGGGWSLPSREQLLTLLADRPGECHWVEALGTDCAEPFWSSESGAPTYPDQAIVVGYWPNGFAGTSWIILDHEVRCVRPGPPPPEDVGAR